MPERSLKPPHRIPTHEDFSAAAELTEDLLLSEGGAWTYYYKTSLLDGNRRESIRRLFEAMSSQARFIEPIRDAAYAPIDPEYRLTHAFMAGMWTAGIISKFIHSDIISYGSIHNSISQSLPHATYATEQAYQENGKFLMSIGHEGANLAGYEARAYLHRWGEDIVSREEARPYYILGAGAVLYASQEVYKQVQPVLQQEYEISLVSDEVSQFLADFTGSSDK